jgi:glycosyltransferase involved in cell wall biosynthesis
MQLRQVLVGAAPGDAVTQIARSIRDRVGPALGAEIYALHRDLGVPDVASVEDLPAPTGPDDILLYHLSIGHPTLTRMLMRRPERLALHYHNITPPEHFDAIDPEFATFLRAGRTEMRMLAPRAVAVFADSTYNALEIQPHTARRVVVVPPPLEFGRLATAEPHPATLHHFEHAVVHPVVLVLGQVLPHKRPDVAVSAAFLLRAHLGVDVQVVIAGTQRNHWYGTRLAEFVERMGLGNVWVTGHLPDDELAAILRNTDVLMVPSLHEGFCVPIVEANHLGIPVVAREAGAIPETLGEGGVLLPADAGPELFAEATARVLGDESLRAYLQQRSAANRDRFGPHTLAPLVSELTEVVG